MIETFIRKITEGGDSKRVTIPSDLLTYHGIRHKTEPTEVIFKHDIETDITTIELIATPPSNEKEQDD